MEYFPLQEIARFCQKWQIMELALFGSVLREDFNSESDVDMLVTFSDKSEWGSFRSRSNATGTSGFDQSQC